MAVPQDYLMGPENTGTQRYSQKATTNSCTDKVRLKGSEGMAHNQALTQE